MKTWRRRTASRSARRSGFSSRAEGDLGVVKREARRREHQHLGVDLADRLPVVTRGRRALAAQQIPAARAANLLRNPATTGGEWRSPSNDDALGPTPLISAGQSCCSRLAEILAQGLDQLDGVVLRLGHSPDRRDRVEYALEADRVERDDRRRDLGADQDPLEPALNSAQPRRHARDQIRPQGQQASRSNSAGPELLIRSRAGPADAPEPAAGRVTTAAPSISGG
jgi:hypothetical protein